METENYIMKFVFVTLYVNVIYMCCGGIAPLIFILGTRQMWVIRLCLCHFTAEKKLCFSLGWMLVRCWSCSKCFAEKIVLLLLPRF